MRKPAPLPPQLSRSGFTVREGREAGLSAGQLRGKGMERLGRGLRAPTARALELAERVGPYTRFSPDCAASHETAAVLWYFPAPAGGWDMGVLHISRPRGLAAVERPHVVGHHIQLPADEVTSLGGLYLTTRPRTWLDLAASVGIGHLVVLADHLVRIPRPEFEGRTEPFATVQELQMMIVRHRGKHGIRAARAAVELCRVGSDSPQETRLRLAMLDAGLPEPQLNRPIRDAAGQLIHTPDLSYPELKVSIDYEGGGHGAPDQVDRDIARSERLAAAGWTEVRISKRHMAGGAEAAIRKIAAALRNAGWPA
ncbi:endonuclease domain-containing protein [Arthrobacter sp. I2-34]|uniref:Endonuclease domain-containing protein n=1 Tax=Arthrobacter hankyongi TaxID=2904801 RepID=A0ABS9L1P6_9MICC|nr:endonuclease domain-containing protein [Arthrobacter hankyongi]MCG2620525.1 endonuclease domain-containing protein [Arthrobacter hankyongi]